MTRVQGKNILMLIPNLEYGGAQLSFVKLCTELAKNNTVYVVAFYLPEKPTYDIPCEVIDLEIGAADTVSAKLSNYFKRKRKIRSIKKEKQIDISISFMEGASYMNSATKGSDRVIVSVRGAKEADATLTGFSRKVHYKYLIPKHYGNADHITVVNNGIAKEMTDYIGIKGVPVTTIPNYYDVNELEAKAAEQIHEDFEAFLSSGKKTLYAFGRFGVEKGFQHLIEVFGKIKDENVQLLLVGDGPMKGQYIESCQRLGISYWDRDDESAKPDNVDLVFAGYDANPIKYAAKADVFALTSASEGFPNALIEAMSTGVCCVSTDCPFGPREIFAPDTEFPTTISEMEVARHGILLPRFTQTDAIDVWAKALEQLLSNDELRAEMGAKSKKRVGDFTKETIMQLWDKVLLGE